VHRNVTTGILLPLVFILIASLGLGSLQEKVALGSNGNQTGTASALDDSSESGSDTSDVDKNQSDTAPDETSGSSSTPEPEAITTTPSDLVRGNETSNVTEETSKPNSTLKRQLSKGLLEDMKIFTPSAPAPDTKIKVTFNAITVHDSHEGVWSGEGEYDLSAYVGIHLVDLTAASGPGEGLWDVDKGERVYFDPGTEVELTLTPGQPFSIMTVGSEVDGCGKTNFPKTVAVLEVIVETIAWEQIEGIQQELNDLINGVTCMANENDILGKINVIHEAPDYGAFTPVGSSGDKRGCDSLRSDKGDFTLDYCVTVLAPPTPVQSTGTTETGKFSGQLNNDLSVLQPEAQK
jgi:hypothetical protein